MMFAPTGDIRPFPSPLKRLLIAVFVVLPMACSEPGEAPRQTIVRPVKIMVIEGNSQQHVELPGRVRASERARLSFEVPGRLIELNAKEGKKVSKGDVIGRLDPRDLQNDLDAARAEYDKAMANFKRAEELVKKDFISRVDYDRIVASLKTTKADLSKARKAMSDSRLVVPFSGVISKRYVENFTDVVAKQDIVGLQDNNVLEIIVDAPERLVMRAKGDIGKLKKIARFNAAPGRTFEVQVKEFATEADPVTQTFQYVFVMPRPDNINILPGMTATFSVTRPAEALSGETSQTMIPALAVFSDEAGTPLVWVVDPSSNQVMKRAVTTGDLKNPANIVISEGLRPGEMIAIAGVGQLSEGQVVKPVEQIRY